MLAWQFNQLKKIYSNYGRLSGTWKILQLAGDVLTETFQVYKHYVPYLGRKGSIHFCWHLLRVIAEEGVGQKVSQFYMLEARKHNDRRTVAVLHDMRRMVELYLSCRRAAFVSGNAWLMRYCFMLATDEPFDQAVENFTRRGLLSERLRILEWLDYLLRRIASASDLSRRVGWCWVLFDEFMYYCADDASEEVAAIAATYNNEVAKHPDLCLEIEKI
jgi:hypothetical protein